MCSQRKYCISVVGSAFIVISIFGGPLRQHFWDRSNRRNVRGTVASRCRPFPRGLSGFPTSADRYE